MALHRRQAAADGVQGVQRLGASNIYKPVREVEHAGCVYARVTHRRVEFSSPWAPSLGAAASSAWYVTAHEHHDSLHVSAASNAGLSRGDCHDYLRAPGVRECATPEPGESVRLSPSQ